jgi:hypothetical protein
MSWASPLSALRHIAGVVFGGAIGGIVWLVVLQEGPERGWSDHNYNQVMGQVFVGREDDVARAGFYGTIAVGIALAAVYALVFEPLARGKHRAVAPLVFAAVPLLLWGFVLSPGVTAYADTAIDVESQVIPGGVFGLDGGRVTLVLGIVGSLLFALAVSRIYRLMTMPAWWKSRGSNHSMAQGVLDGLISRSAPAPSPESLKLPEEGREEGDKGAGR